MSKCSEADSARLRVFSSPDERTLPQPIVTELATTMRRCEAYVLAANEQDQIVPDLLARSLLIRICASFEKAFKDLLLERCSAIQDESIRSYVAACTKVNRLRLSDLRDVLKRFGPHHEKTFVRLVDEDPRVGSSYSSIVTNRNQVAHDDSCSATLRDVSDYFCHGHTVLEHFRQALWEEKAPRASRHDTAPESSGLQ